MINNRKAGCTGELKGTLAFEDIWPDGGDYDMNDVIVNIIVPYISTQKT